MPKIQYLPYHAKGASMACAGKRVLVVEDAPEVRHVISLALRSSGVDVSEAGGIGIDDAEVV